MEPKLTKEEIVFYNEATKSAWTPCNHFRQCLGFCPICLRELIRKSLENEQPPES